MLEAGEGMKLARQEQRVARLGGGQKPLERIAFARGELLHGEYFAHASTP
jgi:hypothetical protein